VEERVPQHPGGDDEGEGVGVSDSSAWAHNELSGNVTGPVVQAGRINEVHFHAAPAAPAAPVRVPREFPSPPRHYVNRIEHLAELDGHVERGSGSGNVVVVDGIRGVGKTGFATQWAHTNRDRFPGGQLYADLDARRHGGGVEVEDVLRDFLLSLGVSEAWIPATLERRAAMLRSTLAAKDACLICLDGADQPAEVLPLLPAAAGNVVLVTSGKRLTAVLAEGAVHIALRPLDAEAGLSLLAKLVDARRVTEDPAAAARIVELCGGLPIAIRIACGKLVAHPRRPLQWLVDELEDPTERLMALDAGGGLDVGKVFDLVVRDLPEPLARTYRLLALHPGPDFSADAATVLLGGSAKASRRLLDGLYEANLLDEDERGRYRFHDLVRLHARQRAELDQSAQSRAERAEAVERIVRWYLVQGYRADWIALGSRLRGGGAPYDDADTVAALVAATGVPGPDLADDATAALDWLETERDNLRASQEAAVAHGWDGLAWRFCDPLWALFLSRKHYALCIEMHKVAAEATVRLADPGAESHIRKQLAAPYRELGRLDDAETELRRSLTLVEQSGNEALKASALEAFGKIRLARGDLDEAEACFTQARTLFERVHETRGVLLQENMLGQVLNERGRFEDAYELLSQVVVAIAAYDERNQARVRLNLARAARGIGRPAEAVEALEQAADRYRRRGDDPGEINALEQLADVELEVGAREAAVQHLNRVVELYRAGGAGPRADAVEPRLRDLAA
jgi:tetratricopeptide (TPR) repeat protein